MPFSSKLKSASRYKPQQDKLEKNMPIFTGWLLILVALKYLAATFVALGKGENFYFIISFLIFGFMMLSFIFLRRGIALEKIYHTSKYAQSSKYPNKLIGAVFLATATTMSAYFGSYTLFSAILFGLSVFIGWYLYYGFDPMEDKLEGYESDKSAKRIMKLLSQANKDIESIRTDAMKANSSQIMILIHDMADEFDKIVQHVTEEPDDYDNARRYLVSYLGELKSIIVTYVKLEDESRSQEIKDIFIQTLQTSIEKLKKQYTKLLDDDILDLDIKLSVMQKRLQNEE